MAQPGHLRVKARVNRRGVLRAPILRGMGGGRRTVVLLVVVLLLVHVPFLHSTWLRWQVDRAGVDVVARVVESSEADGRRLLGFELPATVGATAFAEDERRWTAEVSASSYDEARGVGSVDVRVLPDRPSSYVVAGQVRGPGLWLLPLGLDLLALAGVVMLRLVRSRQSDEALPET